MTRVLAGEWKPDQPASLNEGLITADGCFPIANGYAPIGSFASFKNGTLAARCIGAGGYRYGGTPYLFAATTTNVYTYSSSGYTSIASGLAGTQANGVRFCPFGSYMLITNGVDAIKRFDPASPTALTNLGGTPPTAKYLAVVRGFVVAGFAGGSSLRVQWSDTGNSAAWTAGGSSLAGQFDMPTGGDITGVVGGEYGLIFQERRILRMSFTGDSAIWQFDEVVSDIGCVAPKSLATWGKITMFWSDKGFMAYDGQNTKAIGNEKVDRTFQSLLDRNYYDSMSAAIDPRNGLYIVAVPSSNPTTQVFIYNIALDRWTTAQITSEFLFSALALATTLEDLDSIYASLDAVSVSLDSAGLKGGYPLLLLFDGSHVLGSLSGTALAATFKDGQREYVAGRQARITAIRPITDASAAIVSVSGANALSRTPTQTDYTVRTSAGYYRTRENWNLAQIKVSMPAAAMWTYYQGFDIEAVAGGRP